MADGCLRGTKALSEIKPDKSSKSVSVIRQEGVWMGRSSR